MKKILVIKTSLRPGSNSDYLADEFIRGARSAGHAVEEVSLKGKHIGFCRGCLSCQKTRTCAIRDDAVEITEKMLHADAIAFATPVYYYGMSGQMKTLLDRANPLFASDYAFRDVYLLATAADGDSAAIEGTIDGINCWLSCYEHARLAGVVRGTGANDPGEIKTTAAPAESFRLGASV